MTYSYDRRVSSRLPPSIGRRSAYELRVVAALSAVWPFPTEDDIFSAANGVDVMKKKYADLWQAMLEVDMDPKGVADVIVDIALSEARQFKTAATAKFKFPAIIKGMVSYLKTGPFKSSLKVTSARGGQITLKPIGLNDQVDRMEITDLAEDKAKFMIYMKNGDSGWDWDEWRKPPQFHSNPGTNLIHLIRLKDPEVSPSEFDTNMRVLVSTLIHHIQKTGWVRDPVSEKPVTLAVWQSSTKEQVTKEQVVADVEKIAKSFAAELKTFVASLPAHLQAWERIVTSVDAPPPRGGYGASVTGHVWFQVGFKGSPSWGANYTASVTSMPNGVVWVSVSPGNSHSSISSLSSEGTMKDALARLNSKVLPYFKEKLEESIRNLPKEEQTKPKTSEETWSVVTLGKSHSYATEVETFDSKSKAEQEAKDLGNCYVVKGTQMWNEPLGQVEEHDRTAPYKFFSGR